MGTGEVVAMLWAVRRLRVASIQPGDAPKPVRTWLASEGLGGVCKYFTDWAVASIEDRRTCEAVLRFYGLIQLPEYLVSIARTLVRRDLTVPGAGVSTRQVQNLIRAGVEAMAAGGQPPTPLGTPTGVDRRVDPFPGIWRTSQVQRYRAVLWAWAQVPESASVAAKALLLYEMEHGLRDTAPIPGSRTDRQRWHNLAWSLLEVASYRVALSTGPSIADGQVLLERTNAMRLLVVGDADLGSADIAGSLASLLVLPPWATPIDLIQEAVEAARLAVRERRPEAPGFVGLLSRTVGRVRSDVGARPVPAEISSGLSALAATLAKEHRDIGGVAVAEAGLLLAERSLSSVSEFGGSAVVLSDMLKLSQELAELAGELVLPFTAWRALRHFRRLLDAYGDPDADTEPQGWLHILELTRARVERSMARHSAEPSPWLEQAASHAERAASIVVDGGVLPAVWGVAATVEAVGAWLDLASVRPDDRLVARSADLLERASEQFAGVTHSDAVEYKQARLRIHLASWHLALLRGSEESAVLARSAIAGLGGDWLIARDISEIEQYSSRSSQLGFDLGEPIDWPRPTDRLLLRPPKR